MINFYTKTNNSIKNLRFSLGLIFCSALVSNAGIAQNDSPMLAVETMVESVLTILRSDTLSPEENEIAVKEELFKVFDSRAMAQSVLSTGWRQASTDQQNEFESLFLQTLENTYINRIEAYTDERVEFTSEDINENRATVETVIVTSNNDIPVGYKLRQRSDGWFIYDVVVENVSMVSSYRDTYRSIARRSGMDDLLSQMREKILELENI
jgi:phospholipid transport system substrate-binding protein